MRQRMTEGATIESSGRLFNEWIDKSRSDLALLTTILPTGPYPYAGIPWFATQFGRDAIITALQTLWLNPSLAEGVLRFLALTQAHEESAYRDAEPGKIMHEMRRGEMAVLHEVPFQRYYGGVDTTPLFRHACGRLRGAHRGHDAWWTRFGRTCLRLRRGSSGVWTAASTASWTTRVVRRQDLSTRAGKTAMTRSFTPMAVCRARTMAVVEVQGYAHAALLAWRPWPRRATAPSTRRPGENAPSDCAQLIEERFWIQDMEYYALAIDGEDQPCCVRASNAGHLLYCGVPSARARRRVAQHAAVRKLLHWLGNPHARRGRSALSTQCPITTARSGRTILRCVWPGLPATAARTPSCALLSELFETANQFSMRLPELYCGFARYPGQGPTPYPVACLPQAWASGALFMLLQAALGIRIDGRAKTIHVSSTPCCRSA